MMRHHVPIPYVHPSSTTTVVPDERTILTRLEILCPDPVVNKPLILQKINMSLQLINLSLQVSDDLFLLHFFSINVILELLVYNFSRNFRKYNRSIDLILQINSIVGGLIALYLSQLQYYSYAFTL